MSVSFLIPAYDCVDTLEAAVSSVIDQGLERDHEIVIVDDGSADGTGALAQRLASDHPDVIRTYANEANLGLGATRNRLVELARTDVFYWLDSDNLLPPQIAERVLAPVWAGETYAAATAEVHYFQTDPSAITHTWTMRHTAGWTTAADIVSSPRVPASNANYAYTRAMYDTVGPYADGALVDWVWGLRAAFLGFGVKIVPDSFYWHRYGTGKPSVWDRWVEQGLVDPPLVAVLQEHSDFFDRRSRARIRRMTGQSEIFERYVEPGKLRVRELPAQRRPSD